VKNKIKDLAKRLLPDIIAVRRHLHQHPELSYEEVETGKYVAEKLKALGIEYQHGVATNGVVGMLRGRNPTSKVIALRADLDALPIQEANDTPYKSTKQGIMHACGHDAHTASLLGATQILHELRDHWSVSYTHLTLPTT
jgi:amidohydrolase